MQAAEALQQIRACLELDSSSQGEGWKQVFIVTLSEECAQ
jgi:hypothetical protein